MHKLNIFCCSLYSSLCLWLWRSVVSWWKRGGWSTRASTESQETTLPSPTCRRSSTTRAWTTSISTMMWATLSIHVASIKLSLKSHIAVRATAPRCWMLLHVCKHKIVKQNYPSYLNVLQKWRDLNVISSLLKSFFRKLPEPLFTNGWLLF